MARGDKATYNQQQQQAFGNAQNTLNQANANSQGAFQPALRGYEGELANPGFTAAEQQGITQATEGSLAGAFGAARARAMDTAARTNNPAGYLAAEEELGREQGRENAQALGGLQEAFGQARIQGEQNALAGLGGLYSSTNPQIGYGLNSEDSLVGTQARVATTPSFWSRLASNWMSPGAWLGGGASGGVAGLFRGGRGGGGGGK